MPGDSQHDAATTDARFRHRRVVLYLAAMLFALLLGTALVAGRAELFGWLSLMLGGFFTLWARADARYHHKPLPTLSLWVVFLFWPIAVPACTVRVYGGLAGSVYVALHVVLLAFLIYGPWVISEMAAAS